MAMGDSKVSTHDDDCVSSDSESDSEFTPPTYEELTKLLKKYTKIIMKLNEKLDKIKLEKKDLVSKSNEHEANGTKCKIELDNLKVSHSELESRYSLLKKEFQDLKASYKNLELIFEAMSNDKYDLTKL
jgi:predicted nuclease with TOPRIM domain